MLLSHDNQIFIDLFVYFNKQCCYVYLCLFPLHLGIECSSPSRKDKKENSICNDLNLKTDVQIQESEQKKVENTLPSRKRPGQYN